MGMTLDTAATRHVKAVRKVILEDLRLNVCKIIKAPMRFGKTTLAITDLIPTVKENSGCNVFVLTSPLNDIIDQKETLFKEMCLDNDIMYCTHPLEAIKIHKRGRKVGLYLSNAMSTRNGETDAMMKLLSIIDFSRVCLVLDEIHTWSVDDFSNLEETIGSTNLNYKAVLYKLITSIAAASPYVFGLTATDNNQHKGRVPTIGPVDYEVVVDVVCHYDLANRMGWVGNVTFYNQKDPAETLKAFQEMIDCQQFIEVETGVKRGVLIEANRSNSKSPKPEDVVQMIHNSNFNSEDEDTWIGAVMTDKVKKFFNKRGEYSKPTDTMSIYDALDDLNNPMRFLVIIDMAKMGVDLLPVKEIFSLAVTDAQSKKWGSITEKCIQKLGRGLTPYAGIPLEDFFNVYHADFSKVPNFHPSMNTINFYLPDNDMNRDAMEEFKRNFAPTYDDYIELYHENHDDNCPLCGAKPEHQLKPIDANKEKLDSFLNMG